MISPDSHRRPAALTLLASLTACAALALPANAAAATLADEAVLGISSAALQVQPGSSCNADGSGYIAFEASGEATGPIPGTFEESGALGLGPRGVAGRSPVTFYYSNFTIVSGSATIYGNSTLGEPADMLRFGTFDFQNQGECQLGPFTANQFGVGIRYWAQIPGLSAPADDLEAMSNARNLISQVESCNTDAQDYTQCMTEAQLPGTGLPFGSQPGQVEVTSATENGYTLVGHSLSGVDFTVAKSAVTGITTTTCAPAGQGGCTAAGTWVTYDYDSGFGYATGAEDRLLSPPTLISMGFASLTGVTAPAAPSNVIAAPADASAVVSWVAPASNGGNPVRDYSVTASPGGATVSSCTAPVVQCGQTSVTVPNLSNGVAYTFTVTARNAAGTSDVSAASAAVTPTAGTPTPSIAVGEASATSPTTVSTTSASTSVTVPAGTSGGLVTLIQAPSTTTPPAGYGFLGSEMNITAPTATVDSPLVLVFTVDAAALAAAGVDKSTVQVFRDAVPIDACTTGATGATPDPCVADRSETFGGGAAITVRSSHASAWNLGRRVFSASGLLRPLDPRPAVNLAKAGSAIPLNFSLGGFRGFDVIAAGYPKSAPMTCLTSADVDPIEETVPAGQSVLSYDATSDRYTYVWKTDKSWPTAPGGPCRQLVIRFADGSERRADFRFAK